MGNREVAEAWKSLRTRQAWLSTTIPLLLLLIEPPCLSGIHKAPSLTPTSLQLSVQDGMSGLGPLRIRIPVIFCDNIAVPFQLVI